MAHSTQLVTDIEHVERIVASLVRRNKPIGIDTECRSLQHERRGNLIGVGIANGKEAWYFALRHSSPMRPKENEDDEAAYISNVETWERERKELPPKQRQFPKKPKKPKLRTFDEQIADLPPFFANIDPTEFWAAFAPLMRSGLPLFFHNSPFDLRALMTDAAQCGHAFDMPKRITDTMIALYSMSTHLSGMTNGLSLSAASALVGDSKDEEKLDAFFDNRRVRGVNKRKELLWCAPVKFVAEYCGHDSYLPLKIARRILKPLRADKGALKLYRQERDLVETTISMESRGKHIDLPYVQERFDTGTIEVARLLKVCQTIADDDEFNPRSPIQLAAKLTDRGIKLPWTEKSQEHIDAGRADDPGVKLSRATGAEVLDEHRGDDLVDALFAYRKLDKLIGTYFGAMLRLSITDESGTRMFPSFAQTTARTGRYSSARPNFQNLPTRGRSAVDIAYSVRHAVIAAPGRYLLSVDLSQIEPRCMAHQTKDPALIRLYHEARDLYVAIGKAAFPRTASLDDREWKKTYAKTLRDKAKTIMLALAYGSGPRTTANNIGDGTTAKQARAMIDNVHAEFANLKAYEEHIIAAYRRNGYIRNRYGRKLYLRNADKEYTLFNAMIQSTAADLLKAATLRIYRDLRDASVDCYLLLTVHDELLFSVHRRHLKRALPIIKAGMTEHNLLVPLTCDYAIGKRWSALKEFTWIEDSSGITITKG